MFKKCFCILSGILILFVLWLFFAQFYFKPIKMNILDSDIKFEVKYDGFKKGRDITFDNLGNYYIALKNKIQCINNEGKSYILLKDKNLNINSIEYYNNHIYFSSNNMIGAFDLSKRDLKTIIDNIPNYGDYGDSIIKINNNLLYISIGAATNSGVVGSDNKWIKNSPYNFDLSPKELILNGMNFGKEKTGAFVPYGTKNLKEQKISPHFPANATIARVDLSNFKSEDFAWGIRNVVGMDFDSSGRLLAAVGGMEDRGVRPIKFDKDYIFEIIKNTWYGWPDYSGGDAVNSPRFKGSKNLLIIENPPTHNPPAPIFQNKYLSSLGAVAIDKNGVIGETNTIYFYDKIAKTIYKMNSKGMVKELIHFSSNTNIVSMKFNLNSLDLLENCHGYIIQVQKK